MQASRAAGVLVLLAAIGGGVAAATPRETGSAAEHARLLALVARFDADRQLVAGFEPIPTEEARAREVRLLDEAETAARGFDEAALPLDGRVDLRLFRNDLAARRTRLQWEDEDARAAAPLTAFAAPIVRLERLDRAGEPWSPQELAAWLVEASATARALLDAAAREETRPPQLGDPVALRAAATLARECREFLDDWRQRSGPADPALDFWIREPAQSAVATLGELHQKLSGPWLEPLKSSSAGSPFAIGRERYAAELRFEGIDLTPEQMLAFGEEQLAALQAEIAREARALLDEGGAALREELAESVAGGAPEWRLGLELAKRDTVPIGGQRLFVQQVAEEAIRFAHERQLFPIPPLAEECWRLRLSDRSTQGTYAYGFYGRNFMGVAAPLPDMDHERKLECMKSNARPFTRTVVPHELIPGHHLQGFFAKRRPERLRYSSAFFTEGFAVHGEITFDEHGFFAGPRERIGHLFWRLLRAARIVVSTRYHLRQTTQAEMVELMVDNAGLERSAAQAEVDRYMTYSPLYQCAYLYGATQIRRLREECQAAWGTSFSELRFNTALIEQGTIPLVFAREALLGMR